MGALGESIAQKFLENKRYKIIEKNYRNKYGEIDLVCQKDDILVFVEVKTRKGEEFGTPEDAFKKEKIKRLIKNAQGYFKKSKVMLKSRIDAICIVLDKDEKLKRISHYENITAT